MSKNLVKLSAMALLVCGLGMVTACGDETEETNNTNPNNTNPNNTNECPTGQVKATVDGTESCRKDCATDETVCGATEMCATAGDKKVCVAKPAAECDAGKVKVGDVCLTDCSADANVCQATEECKVEGANSVCREKMEELPDKTAPTCADDEPPARCAADAATFTEWAPASVINTFVLDEACCFDFNGDGTPDNSLAGIISIASSVEDINATIKESIDAGSIAIVLEHDGVQLDADGDFTVQFLLGEPVGETKPAAAGGNEYKINPASFEMGTYGQAVALGTKTGTAVAAGPGSIVLNIELLGIELALKVSGVQITADIDAANSGADKGIALNAGKLGGFVRAEDLAGAINTFAGQNCGCIQGLDGMPLIQVEVEPPSASLSCTNANMLDASTCDESDQTQGICKTLVDDACGLLSAVGIALDIDSNAVGQDCLDPVLGLTCDSISIGAKFTAVGAKISGVVEAAPGE